MPRWTRVALWLCGALVATLLATLGYARYATFHNETFDLAFYARMAWGLSRGDFWEPIVGAHVFGIHLSPILVPLGLVGRVAGTVPVLLVTQAVAIAGAAWPLARMGYRRFGEAGALAGAACMWLYPNVVHVGTFEFHPGTVAVLPLAWALEGLDRRSNRLLFVGVLGVLVCREDLGLITMMLGLVAARSAPEMRRVGYAVAGVSLAWVLLFVFVLHPAHAPRVGSMQLHFGIWGDTIPEAAVAMLTSPLRVLMHLAEPQRLAYLPQLLAPLAFLPLLKPRWLLVASPVLAVNLMSEWPTTTDLDCHYQTILLPLLVAGALDGAVVVGRGLRARWVLSGLMSTVVAAHLVLGGSPISADFDSGAFEPDDGSRAAARILEAIPADASVQVPYAMMAHVAERQLFGPSPPPERVTDFVVLDAWHRQQYEHDERLLRTTEEPTVRQWLARPDHGLVDARDPYILLQRGADPRSAILYLYRMGTGPGDPTEGQRIAACLAIRHARIDSRRGVIVLSVVARGPCPSDLAIRIGTGYRPARVDLLFHGLISPAHLRRGDRLESFHPVTDAELEAFTRFPLRVGALRSSGARPEHADPVSVTVPWASD